MIYTLCGSSRFPEAFHLVNAHLSMRGHIVISLGLFGHADEPRGAKFLTSDGDESTAEKVALDQLHLRKIDMADAIFVVNVGGYIGSSTKREIAYAESKGKTVEWLFKPSDLNRCHVCGGIAVHSDAALCLTCSTAADRGEVAYDPDTGWHQVLPGQRAAPEAALPNGSNIEVSTVREGFR